MMTTDDAIDTRLYEIAVKLLVTIPGDYNGPM